MKAKYLFPSFFKLIGFIMAIPGLILGYLCTYRDYEIAGFGFNLRAKGDFFQSAFENFTNELAILLSVTGLLFIAFSRRKHEDELTAKLRLDALYWAVFFNYVLFFVLIVIESAWPKDLVFKWTVIDNMGGHVFNLYMPLLIFVIRYHYLLYKNKDQFVVGKLRFFPTVPFRKTGQILSPIFIAFILIVEVFGSDAPDWVRAGADISYYPLIITLLFWAFSKQKKEDEVVAQLRLESLQLAVYFNYVLLLILNFTIYGGAFLIVTTSYFFSLLLFFVICFEYKKYRFLNQDEKTHITGGLLA